VSGIVPDLPIWAQWFAALAVPIAATVGVGLGILNYQLQVRKRRDEIYDKRFEFYHEFTRQMLKKLREVEEYDVASANAELDDFINEWAAKAKFLFPGHVRQGLLGLKRYDLIAWIEREVLSERPIDDVFLSEMTFR
jgi:hypothetical protein